MCQGDSEAMTFSQVVHLEDVYLNVECVQVVAWISLSLVARYFGHFESRRRGLFLNLLSEGRMIIVPYLFNSDEKGL